ncbi:MAG TPA: CSLREA domain-containing protein [Dokdonella sp.]|jgi:CSLREA domain-containing protein|uniref:CSLREA domain-containing protein n=1 Tax=Dokdonella sp. TaxID=2291710 RepID=UPI002B841EBB|nr:CSLREA domain-containing protein [Dokdonella sp.]HNV08453.1 CSLREA domain-containing protein [Dokdonella sp.]
MYKMTQKFAAAAIAIAAVALAQYAAAATITVNSIADVSAADGACTLREALQAANTNLAVNGDCVAGQAAPTVDLIAFAIPGSGPHVITPTGYMGAINETLTIDGMTQPGAVANSATPAQGGLNGTIVIEISGVNCAGCNFPIGLGLTSGEATFRGLAISHFPAPINLASASPATIRIEGCHIGTDVNGLTATGAQNAIGFNSGVWSIGGTTPAKRNLIVAASSAIWTQSAASITVQGNLIGTTRDGLAPLPMSGDAIHLRLLPGGSAQIGGSDTSARNVIGSAGGYGLHLIGFGADGSAFRVEGNHIGVGADGVAPVPNLTGGVRWGTNSPVVNGWPIIGNGNLIAWNAGPAVVVAGGTNAVTEVVGNSMHDNGLGIDLDENGRTPNDPADADSGSNLRMNHPEFDRYDWSNGQYALRYRVDTALANAAYPLRVDFYLAADVDDAEGMQWLGSDTIDAGDAQQWRDFSLPGPQGHALVATTTDALGRSSEFSGPDRLFADSFELP